MNPINDFKRRPHALRLQHTIVIQRPVADVFDFLVTQLPDSYIELASGHKRFALVGAERLEEGVWIDCEEQAGNQDITHQYQVTEVVPETRIAYQSCPSRGLLHTPRRTIETTSNTFSRGAKRSAARA